MMKKREGKKRSNRKVLGVDLGKSGIKRAICILVLFAMFIATLKVFLVIRSTPELSIEDLSYGLGENSKIIDSSGRVIGESVGSEFRSYIKIDDLPSYVPEAFVSIEDKRFYTHMGIDIRGIFAATLDNIKAGSLVRGASTITQQLIKNTHLSNEKTIDRKIKEAFLSFKLERNMDKDEILEAYLNTTFFGQGAYGIESASNIYFSKSAKDLKLEEAAILAAIIQSPNKYAPYKRLNKADVDYNTDTVLGDVVVGGNRFTCVYSGAFEDRRDLVLKEMYRQGKISKESLDLAINTPSVSLIKPSERTMSDQMYYLSDFIKKEATEVLMDKYNYSFEKASYLLDVGGYTIKTSVDMEIQNEINDIYDNRDNIRALLKNLNYTIDKNTNNMLSPNGDVLYYDRKNIIDSDYNFYFTEDEYLVKDGGLYLNSPKIEYDSNNIYYKDYYGFTDEGDLYIYNIDRTSFEEGELLLLESGVFITPEYLSKNPDFFVNDGNTLNINNKYYNVDKYGKKQPDATSMVINPETSMIIGMYGGSNQYVGVNSNKMYSQRFSPLKLIRPFSLYYPATLREDIVINKEMFSNQHSSDLYGKLGKESSLESMKLFGFIDENNPSKDSFVSADESALYNDESVDALVYGRFTNGLTLHDIGKAYGLLLSKENKEPSIVLSIIDTNGEELYSAEEKRVFELNEVSKFKLKRLLSKNDNYIGINASLTNKRDLLTLYGSEDFLILSFITNNESKLQFSEDVNNNIINKIILEKFGNRLNSRTFSTPEGIFRYSVCSETGLLANESCIANNLSLEGFYETEIKDICNIDHNPVEEEEEDVSEIDEDIEGEEDTDEESEGLTEDSEIEPEIDSESSESSVDDEEMEIDKEEIDKNTEEDLSDLPIIEIDDKESVEDIEEEYEKIEIDKEGE